MRAVFLHAFGADRLAWAGTTTALPGIDAITPDLPGHGKSLADLGDGSLDDMAARLLAGVDGGPPAWLVGHSLGGGLALRLAADAPERWLGLVLMAPIGLGMGFDHAFLSAYPGLGSRDEVRRFLERLVERKDLIALPFVDHAFEQLERDGARDALARIAGQLPAMESELSSLAPRVAESGLDVTVIWGAEDRVARPDPARIGKLGSLVEIPGAGHIVHVEARKRVNALLAARMERLRR